MMGGRMYADDATTRHFRADPDYGLTGEHRYVEVRYFDASCTEVDEICTESVHLEMMDEDKCWMDVAGLHVWFNIVPVKGSRRKRLVVTCFPSYCKPFVIQETAEKRSIETIRREVRA